MSAYADPATITRDPAGRLVDLAAALAEGRKPDPADAEHFARAVGAWIECEAANLDEALGVGGADGLQGARSRYRRAQRDAHLRRAAAALDATGRWARAVALADAVDTFCWRVWPAWQHMDAPPPGASSVNRHLWHARRHGPLPGTARRLHDIIREAEDG